METCEDRGYRCCETLTPSEHTERHGYASTWYQDELLRGGDGTPEREARLTRIGEVYPEAAEEARRAGN